jgi:hypothetical protein
MKPRFHFPWGPALIVGLVVVVFLVIFVGARWALPGRHDRSYAAAEVTQLAGALAAYRSEYGDVPKGSPAEIIAALTGGNTRKIIFIEVPSDQLNEKGEFVDPWGTPYHFVPTDPAEKPHVYSLGPNKVDEQVGDVSDDIESWRY